MSRGSVLITGGAGFIGSHLADKLVSQGSNVIIIDNFNDFYEPELKRKNIVGIRAKLVEGDICDRLLVDELFARNQIDLVVHLAAMAGVRPSIANPELYFDVNINGTLNLLDACKRYTVKKFIFASSSSVYGNNKKVPFSEKDNVDYPISPYAASKKSGELLCHTYHHLYDIDVACLRFFTVYGPRQRPDLAIHKFTRKIFSDEEIPFFGDGSTQRDYTYIDDIIDGVLKAIDWVCTSNGKYDIFNLGESRTISLSQMVATLEKVIGKKAKIKRLPMQPGDVTRTYADITKSRKILGYNPTVEFEVGVESFIKWFKEMNDLLGE